MVKSLAAAFLSITLLTGCSAAPATKPTPTTAATAAHIWSQQYKFNTDSLTYLKWSYSSNLNGWYKTYNKTACILNVIDDTYDLFWSELDKTKTQKDVETLVIPKTVDDNMVANMKTFNGPITFYGVRQLLSDAIVDSYYSANFDKKQITVFSLTCDFNNTKNNLETNWNKMNQITNDLTSKALLENK